MKEKQKTKNKQNKQKSLILIERCLKCFANLDKEGKNILAVETVAACPNGLEFHIAVIVIMAEMNHAICPTFISVFFHNSGIV